MDVVPEADAERIEAVEGVTLALLAGGEQANVQHFAIEPGAGVPEHDHPHEQLGLLVEGELVFAVDGEERVVTAGDTYAIPGGEAHAAENRADVPAVGIDVFSPPRPNPDWLE